MFGFKVVFPPNYAVKEIKMRIIFGPKFKKVVKKNCTGFTVTPSLLLTK